MQLEHRLSALLQPHLHSRLDSGFKEIGKDSLRTVRESFKCWDLVRLILGTWRYSPDTWISQNTGDHSKTTEMYSVGHICLQNKLGISPVLILLWCVECLSKHDDAITPSALLSLCEGNSPVPGGLPQINVQECWVWLFVFLLLLAWCSCRINNWFARDCRHHDDV